MKKLTRRPVLFGGKSVGLDVHQSSIVYSVLDGEGEEVAQGKIPSTRGGLDDLLILLGGEVVQCAIEASGGFLWVYDYLAERVGPEQVQVAQAHVLRTIINGWRPSMRRSPTGRSWWMPSAGTSNRSRR